MLAKPQSNDKSSPLKRPFAVTLLILEVLIFTGLNGFRCLDAFRYWDYLSSIAISISPLYLALSGALWFLTGSVLIWMTWRAKPTAPKMMRAFAVVYGLYYWVDRWLLTVSTLRERWPFAVLMTIIGLAFVFIVLSRPKVTDFFLSRVQ